MTALPERQELVTGIELAHAAGARVELACAEAGLSIRTYQRWRELGDIGEDGRPAAQRPQPTHKLSPEERQQVLDVCHEPRFADLPPTQIVPRLADEGVYLASESTFYRILDEAKENNHRGRSRARTTSQPKRHVATGPNCVWCWDVTYLPSEVRGVFFYLFAIIDLYSRKLVAWEVHERETGEEAAMLIERACWREHLRGQPLILHSDNGAAQKAYTLKAKLEALGITPSHSRPGVSDDNPHIESWFRTVKYMPSYPARGFQTIAAARQWTQRFVTWYNTEHRHSAIAFVTPQQRHAGCAPAILAQRHDVYVAARDRNPLRWKRHTRRWQAPDQVWLNPPAQRERVATKT
jgi:transposase InsO family protein